MHMAPTTETDADEGGSARSRVGVATTTLVSWHVYLALSYLHFKLCMISMTYFQDEVLPEYKFLLSLESSMCKDFVTRNFYTALRKAVVPVVLGMCK